VTRHSGLPCGPFLGLGVVLTCIALGLSACAGGSSGAPSTQPPGTSEPPPPPDTDLGLGAVTIRVITTSGMPIPGVHISLNGSFDGRSAETDTDGKVRFTDVPASEAMFNTYVRGFHDAGRRFVIERDKITELTVALARAAEATPVVLAAHATPADGARMLTVDVDLAVLGEDGLAISTLAAADFEVASSDCAFMWCVEDASGKPLLSGGYYAHVDADAFAWYEASTEPSPPSATALLLEQSTSMIEFDPGKRRSAAIHGFLDSVNAPDTVAVASYHGTPQAPVLTTYGPFTSDGALFRNDVTGLAEADASLNPLYPALGDMLSWTATAAGGGADPRSVVLVSGGWSWPDDNCIESWTCPHASRVAVGATSRALNIPIVAIGGGEPAADIAARSSGSFVVVQDPEQYAVVLANLKSIVARSLGFNRVRLILDAGSLYGPQAGRVFDSGHTVWAYATVRIAPDTWLGIPVVIPIP
jgi:hypothetical protein